MQVARPVNVHQITEHAARHGADARLQQDVGWFHIHCVHLFHGFVRQGGVALHNPGRDGGVTFPGRVLHHFPAVLLGVFHGQAHGVVIVHIGDDALRAQLEDRVDALLRGAFRHIHHGVLAELLRRPRHAATVVPVGGGGEGHFLADGGFDGLKREIGDVDVVFLAQ